jgi:hypothetical protein
MKTSLSVLGLFLAVVAYSFATPVQACECLAPADFEQNLRIEYQKAAAVFRGVARARRSVDVGQIDPLELGELPGEEQMKWFDSAEIEFTVREVWKGDYSDQIPVRTPPRDGACGTGLELGAEYIVFAYAIPNDDSLHMNLCAPTVIGLPRSLRYENTLRYLRGQGASEVARVALPPNEGMELTGKSVTALARGRARAAPLFPAAHP